MRLSRLTALLVSVLVATQVWSAGVESARADARTDYLIQTLRTSDSFRVRAQAALSLGQLRPPSAEVLEALSRALRDAAPAVRTAAATSLGRLEDPSALAALRAARRDASADVRQAVDNAIMALQRVAAQRGTSSRSAATRSGSSGGASGGCTTAESPRGRVRYYVGIGDPGSAGSGVSREMLERAREAIACAVSNLEGVELAPSDESNSAARREVQRRRLTGYYIDSSIVSVEQTSSGTRVRVSVVVATYPGRDIRAMLQGSATASGSSASTQRLALEGAIRSALRQLPQVFDAGAR
jgi:hypothetical protein